MTKRSRTGLRNVLIGVVVLPTAVGILLGAACQASTDDPQDLGATPDATPLLRASPDIATLYLLPVPLGSKLIEQHNVKAVDLGKIQADFRREATESYRVRAAQGPIAAFFRDQLAKQRWVRESPDRRRDGELTLSYSMPAYSWSVRILIAAPDPSGWTWFRVTGRKDGEEGQTVARRRAVDRTVDPESSMQIHFSCLII